jgi:hypothetical protein
MIEKTTLTVSSDKLPGTDMPDGTASSQSGGSKGSLAGYNETWGTNPWRKTTTEPEGSGDIWNSGPAEGPETEPSEAPMNAGDLARGYKALTVERTKTFDPDLTGEEPVGDPYVYGGILGRPRGTAR